jgi:hypothetical protein
MIGVGFGHGAEIGFCLNAALAHELVEALHDFAGLE